MKKQKGKFLLFVFSLCPGAGHMYMGLMKMGVSVMLGFMLGVFAVSITGISALAVLPITLYIYSFFHANNIGGMEAEQFAALEDEYLFGFGDWDMSRFKLDKKNRNIAAVVCILIGVSMLWNVGFGMLRDYVGWDNPFIKAVYYTMRDEVPRVIIAIAIIWFGVSLMRGKKLDSVENDRHVEADSAKKPVILLQSTKEPETDEQKVEEPDLDMQSAEDCETQENEQAGGA